MNKTYYKKSDLVEIPIRYVKKVNKTSFTHDDTNFELKVKVMYVEKGVKLENHYAFKFI